MSGRVWPPPLITHKVGCAKKTQGQKTFSMMNFRGPFPPNAPMPDYLGYLSLGQIEGDRARLLDFGGEANGERKGRGWFCFFHGLLQTVPAMSFEPLPSTCVYL
jgi:hypothetical protein